MADPPKESPRPPRNDEVPGLEHTPAYGIATNGYVVRKLEEARAAGHREAKVAGVAWGGGLVVVAIGLAFGIWFKAEAMAAEKDAVVLHQADAGVDRKLAPIAVDIAVLKRDVAELKGDVSDIKKSARDNADMQRETLRLLRKRDAGR